MDRLYRIYIDINNECYCLDTPVFRSEVICIRRSDDGDEPHGDEMDDGGVFL